MADGMVALKISSGRVEIRGRVRMAGQDELRQMEAFRLAGVVFDGAVQGAAPGFAGFKLVNQAFWETAGLELDAVDVDSLLYAVEHHEIAALRPRLGVVI